jgi:hypothetical protein
MLSITLFWLLFCLFQFNRNTETLCFGIELKQPKPKRFVSESAKASFGSSFICLESKLVSKDPTSYLLLLHIPSELESHSLPSSSCILYIIPLSQRGGHFFFTEG